MAEKWACHGLVQEDIFLGGQGKMILHQTWVWGGAAGGLGNTRDREWDCCLANNIQQTPYFHCV